MKRLYQIHRDEFYEPTGKWYIKKAYNVKPTLYIEVKIPWQGIAYINEHSLTIVEVNDCNG